MSAYNNLIGIGIDFGMPEVSVEDRIKTIADVGFDAVFCGWRADGCVGKIARLAAENGLILQSVHAPFKRIDRMWQEGDEGEAVLSELCQCLDDCAANSVNIMVSHAWIGFLPEAPNDVGVDRFSRLLDRAEKLGVTVALENTEGEGYLSYLWSRLSDRTSAGFCIDTGHEFCYNIGRDMIETYGNGGKLVATHIDDNLGMTGDTITWYDDYHLLPFDGKVDWQSVADRLVGVGYNGILTFELKTKNNPGRNANDIYASLNCEEYLSRAYERAVRIAKLIYDARENHKI